MELLVTGGYEDGSGECFVERVAPGYRERVLTFTPPPSLRVAGKGFTGGAWLDNDLLLCTFNAVWRFTPSGKVLGRLHQADFNDLHGVTVLSSGRIAVCNTGLDAIDTFDLDGHFTGRYAFTPGWFEHERQGGLGVPRDRFTDILSAGWLDRPHPTRAPVVGSHYGDESAFHQRRVRDYLHPNHVCEVGSHLAVTMLATREVRCGRTFQPLVALPGHPHDGLPDRGRLLVTLTDGRVLAVVDGRSDVILDTAQSGHLGWCRGLAVAPGTIAVGLTEMRRQPQYKWRSDPIERTETSVLWFDEVGRLVGRMDLTDQERHAKVFALLHPAQAWT